MDGPNSSTSLELSRRGFESEAGEEFGKASGALEKVEDVSFSFDYTSCFCEENVYMLCTKLSKMGLAAPDASDLFAVFISNPERQVPIWRQKRSEDAAGLCIWDYHVICIRRDLKRKTTVLVWDLDTSLPCPTILDDYVAGAFQPWVSLKPEFSRLYRVIAAPMYLRFFASDRRHMKRKDGSWIAHPPLYDCIVAEDGSIHNLEEFITMSVDHVTTNPEEAKSSVMHQKLGILLDEKGLLQFFN